MDLYGFYTGTEFEAYQYLGAHECESGIIFRTFAPNAEKISLIGEFNGWEETPMYKINDGNFWECRVEHAQKGMMYKYKIYPRGEMPVDHSDPYGFFSELRPNTASIIYDEKDFTFQDDTWMKQRSVCFDRPFNIYEIHTGSWKKKNENGEQWYTYRELADRLIPYLTENGYNYVEMMPLSEHPCDESWGYQNTGFFAPTSRYGTPNDLRYFVNACHNSGIGVLMDFVPVHFAVNADGLWRYDGTALYEYPHHDVGVSEWGSCNFMHSRGEVRSFLQSAAHYWISEFHFDGLRMDAVNNLIYWQGNPARGENRMAVQFLQNLNAGIKQRFPDVILMAEDSSSYPNVTKPVSQGGLGFDYKWDMGWMNDTLNYFKTPPKDRREKYHSLTFSMMYYYNERYLLPFSHDEVVHGKGTIIQKMYGEYEEKFSQLRALYMYMYAHPGKKLNFMGNEIAQFREWDEKREQDWEILKYPKHEFFHNFMIALNQAYQKNPALWQKDYESEGFQWLDCHQEDKGIYAFERRGGGQRILALFHFSDQNQSGYELAIPGATKLSLIFSGKEEQSSEDNTKEIPVWNGKVTFDLPPFSAYYYEIISCVPGKTGIN